MSSSSSSATASAAAATGDLTAMAVVAPPPPNPTYTGITNWDAAMIALATMADADADHDFSHADINEAFNMIRSSYNSSCGLTPAAYQKSALKVLALLKNHKNAYSYFKEHLHYIFPCGTDYKTLKDEDAVVGSIGLEFGKYKDKLNAHVTANFNDSLKPLDTATPFNVNLSTDASGNPVNVPITANILQQYKISAYPTKIRDQKLSIRSALRGVSPTSNIFIMIIDASFISMTEIQKITGTIDSNADPITVYVIRSIENSADAARKISNLEKETKVVSNIIVRYLDDDNYISTSPPFSKLNAMNQMSNLFTTLSLKCYRKTDDKVTAEIKKTNGSIITIDDIGNVSEINRATRSAIEQLIIHCAKNNGTPSPESWEEILVYLLLKRSGDWRQALCLLDRDRKYTVTDAFTDVKEPYASLNELMGGDNKGKVELFLMTHDRILLTYAMYLGLNVGYSLRAPIQGDTGNYITWLVYFKNVADANVPPEVLFKHYNGLMAKIEGAAPSPIFNVDGLYQIIRANVGRIQAMPLFEFGNYITQIRLVCHLLKQITPKVMVDAQLVAIRAKWDSIKAKKAAADAAAGTDVPPPKSCFTDMLQLETEIANAESIYDTLFDIHRWLEEYVGQLQLARAPSSSGSSSSAGAAEDNDVEANRKITEYFDTLARRIPLMPSDFISEYNIIKNVKKLLDNGTSVTSKLNGSASDYEIFKKKTLESASKDYKQITDITDTRFDATIKGYLKTVMTPTIEQNKINELSRTKKNNWNQVRIDIKIYELPITEIARSMGGYIRQFGGAIGDDDVISVQQNIISLRENILPFDATEAEKMLTEQYNVGDSTQKDSIALLELLYPHYIGKVELNEPYYTDFILECIDLVMEDKKRREAASATGDREELSNAPAASASAASATASATGDREELSNAPAASATASAAASNAEGDNAMTATMIVANDAIIKGLQPAIKNLLEAYPQEPTYNKLYYGMSFVENGKAFTIADRYVISEREGKKLLDIFRTYSNQLDNSSAASSSSSGTATAAASATEHFQNTHSKSFLLYRSLLYVLDMINNELDSFKEVYEDEDETSLQAESAMAGAFESENSFSQTSAVSTPVRGKHATMSPSASANQDGIVSMPTLLDDIIYSYGDISYKQLLGNYWILLFVNHYICEWNALLMAQLNNFMSQMNTMKIEDLSAALKALLSIETNPCNTDVYDYEDGDEKTLRDTLKVLCAEVRIKCILKYHSSINKNIGTEEMLDLIIHILPSNIATRLIENLLDKNPDVPLPPVFGNIVDPLVEATSKGKKKENAGVQTNGKDAEVEMADPTLQGNEAAIAAAAVNNGDAHEREVQTSSVMLHSKEAAAAAMDAQKSPLSPRSVEDIIAQSIQYIRKSVPISNVYDSNLGVLNPRLLRGTTRDELQLLFAYVSVSVYYCSQHVMYHYNLSNNIVLLENLFDMIMPSLPLIQKGMSEENATTFQTQLTKIIKDHFESYKWLSDVSDPFIRNAIVHGIIILYIKRSNYVSIGEILSALLVSDTNSGKLLAYDIISDVYRTCSIINIYDQSEFIHNNIISILNEGLIERFCAFKNIELPFLIHYKERMVAATLHSSSPILQRPSILQRSPSVHIPPSASATPILLNHGTSTSTTPILNHGASTSTSTSTTPTPSSTPISSASVTRNFPLQQSIAPIFQRPHSTIHGIQRQHSAAPSLQRQHSAIQRTHSHSGWLKGLATVLKPSKEEASESSSSSSSAAVSPSPVQVKAPLFTFSPNAAATGLLHLSPPRSSKAQEKSKRAKTSTSHTLSSAAATLPPSSSATSLPATPSLLHTPSAPTGSSSSSSAAPELVASSALNFLRPATAAPSLLHTSSSPLGSSSSSNAVPELVASSVYPVTAASLSSRQGQRQGQRLAPRSRSMSPRRGTATASRNRAGLQDAAQPAAAPSPANINIDPHQGGGGRKRWATRKSTYAPYKKAMMKKAKKQKGRTLKK
jgi:hypothetical protein